MGSNFFEPTVSPQGETAFRVNHLQFSSDDLVKILQNILIRKEANNAEASYHVILERARSTLSKGISDGVEEIIAPLYIKFLVFFRVLISMENGSPVHHVDWDRLEASLLGIDLEIKTLFKRYSTTIWTLQHLVLIPFFQTFLADPRTKACVADSFKNQSIQPILYQMILNEHEAFGIATPHIAVEIDSVLNATEGMLLETAVERIAGLEFSVTTQLEDEARSYIRDLAYLQILSTEDFYYFNAESKTWKTCRLTELSRADLLQLLQQLLQSPSAVIDEQHEQRTLLQLLAVLHALYHEITHLNLSEQEFASILLALKQSRIELQWQLDVYQTSPATMLLYMSLLCLRGDVVHIEQAERLLTLEDESASSRVFLQSLGIVYTPYLSHTIAKMGLLHIQNPKSQPNTYYFGSQVLCFGSHPALNNYFAQALLEIKQRVLQPFDTWYAVLRAEVSESNMLQKYREGLLDKVEKAWIQYVAAHAPYQHLLHVDQMIEFFQNQHLGQIWQETAQELMGWANQQTLSQTTQKRLGFLSKESNTLVVRHPARYAAALPQLTVTSDSVGRQLLLARLSYERIYWMYVDKMQWIQAYMKRQMVHLQRLCPAIDKGLTASEQLKFLIRYLAELPRNTFSIEAIAATTLCVNLFRCLCPILPWSAESKVQDYIAYLSQITSDAALRFLGEKVMTEFFWVTQTDSFYYQWLESNTVKQAAETVYRAAQRLSIAPANKKNLKAFLVALTEQQNLLAQKNWYVPWGWLWGYTDTREVLAMTRQQVRRMVSLQQIPVNLVQEAEESARCFGVMQDFQTAVEQLEVAPIQREAFQRVLKQIQTIQTTYSGFAKLYALRAYLETQRQKFVQTNYSCFYGPRHRDQMTTLLSILDHGLHSLGQNAQTIFADRNFLAQKAQQIQAQQAGVTDVRIHPGYGEEPFVDVWITSTEAIRDFQPDTRSTNTWHKRFYHINDLCAYTRELRMFKSLVMTRNTNSDIAYVPVSISF